MGFEIFLAPMSQISGCGWRMNVPGVYGLAGSVEYICGCVIVNGCQGDYVKIQCNVFAGG